MVVAVSCQPFELLIGHYDNFAVSINQVGVVGRTGAGNSSLINALYHLAVPGGNLMIDGVSLSDLHPTILRSCLSVIPQVSQKGLN